ncbi:hypothetical protein [Chryseobacterium mulctrae]|uniref:hypothetical protein n=1 Tax=Chryseobacterium mulctrae TaxID=2576777 RepID=UPI0011177AF5|nr:hypothetical protein [Chryseobacterium mulctrae]
MDLLKFNRWMVDNFQHDCQSDLFYSNVLQSVHQEFKNSKVDGIPFEEYYQEASQCRLVHSYMRRLESLIKTIEGIPSNMSLNVVGIPLHDYSNRIEELQSQLSLLKNQYSNVCGSPF